MKAMKKIASVVLSLLMVVTLVTGVTPTTDADAAVIKVLTQAKRQLLTVRRSLKRYRCISRRALNTLQATAKLNFS